ncbi:ribose-phosphate pyrophosphokinase [Chloroherpeton thalassium ATCC 35110]|uniref:Ribose-phosphate pyrophosphokinase n=1 Tax=Chloroherpeton thalassium (strain ATCC 35110 / GB-78) TaxID=517418 RepID=B3QWH5_CHLT3|nr:ribose-phosphate pyrophosphokinase [Chloroherpeton thalassium]ACF14735.1 ribose-phosphate pyrophosphokinase [Chloroherpeton thalassium ATCC 35110]
MDRQIKIFSGRSNRPLAEKIADYLSLSICDAEVGNFSDGEISAQYNESIRGSDLFIIQSTNPPAENLMELLILIDAAKRSSANRVTAVMPYYGYARQDRKDKPRVSITAKLIANLITKAGADRILTMDLHAAQIQGFFDIPFDHLYSSVVLVDHIKKMGLENLIIASPDVGGVKLARSYASRLGTDLVIVDKRRPRPNVAEVMNIIGDVRGKNVLLVDDLIDTAGTMVNAAQALKNAGAVSILAACTHPILSGKAVERISSSVIEKVIMTDTVVTDHADCDKFELVSVSALFGEAIKRIYDDASVSHLFETVKA